MRALAVWDLSAVVETEGMICLSLAGGAATRGGAAAPPPLAALSMTNVAIDMDQDQLEGPLPLTPSAPVSPRYAYRRVTGLFA